jgi:O-methyltransferase
MSSESNTPTSVDEDVSERPSEEELRAAHVDLGATREVRAPGPAADAESLRAAYLGLLKLSLCDLAGARTLSVSRAGDGRTPGSQVFSRELTEDEIALRVRGADWPFSGLSMIGLPRLDDLESCVESVVADGVDGDLIEAGAWRGGASILMRATLDSLGEDGRTVWVADSFQGLPPPNAEAFPQDRELDLSHVDFLAVPLEEVQGYFARFGCERGVEFVPGFFHETLPALRGHRWSVVRLDGDTYESTWLALEALYPSLSSGGYVIIDDYQLIEECREAVEEFRRRHGITEPIEEIDWNGVRWRRATEPQADADATVRTADASSRLRDRHIEQAVERTGRAPLPTARELEMEAELSRLRARLELLEGDRGSRGPARRSWIARLRRRAGRRGGTEQ